jgi:hypothetical protein
VTSAFFAASDSIDRRITSGCAPGSRKKSLSPVLRRVLLVVRRIVAPPLLLALLVAATRRGRAATPLRSPV